MTVEPKAGVLDKLFEKMQEEQIVRIKIESVTLDSIVKVHHDGNGPLEKRSASRRIDPAEDAAPDSKRKA